MTQSDDLKRENEALRARSATLNAAIRRINASLDLETVLGEVMERARGLTDARYGIIATVDEAGAPRDFVFSGFTPEELRAPHLARPRPSVRALPRAAGAASPRRPLGLRLCARHRARPDVLPHLSGHADAPPGRGRRPLLPRRQGERRGVHRRRRGGADPVRLPGRRRDR